MSSNDDSPAVDRAERLFIIGPGRSGYVIAVYVRTGLNPWSWQGRSPPVAR